MCRMTGKGGRLEVIVEDTNGDPEVWYDCALDT